MFGNLFANDDQRRKREVLKAYDALVEQFLKRKRSLRQKAVADFTTARPGCSFLMNYHSDGFLVLDPVKSVIVEGRFIDRYLIRPEFIGDHEPNERRVAVIDAYHNATKISDVRVVRDLSEGDRWFFPGEYERRARIVSGEYVTRTYAIEEMLYVAVRRNGHPLCSVNAFNTKQHLYFSSYLPQILRAHQATALKNTSVLSIEMVLPGPEGRLVQYEHIYDDFNKNGLAKREFDSMLEMVIEFLTVAERMTHEANVQITEDDDLDWHLNSVCSRISDLEAVPGWAIR